LAGGTATERRYSCTPNKAGSFLGTVESSAYNLLKMFFVSVESVAAGSGPGSSTGSTTSNPGGGTSAVSSDIHAIGIGPLSNTVLLVKKDGTVWVWGDNVRGTAGAQPSSGTASWPTPRPMQNMPYAGFDRAVVGSHTGFAMSNGKYSVVWGNGHAGMTGLGNLNNQSNPVYLGNFAFVDIRPGQDFIIALSAAGNVYEWGNAFYRGLPNEKRYSPNLLRTLESGQASEIAAGLYHAVALLKDGSVWTWGNRSSQGQLGREVAESGFAAIMVPVKIMSDVAHIWAGANSGYALKKDGSLWAWGANDKGQLGDGTTIQRNVPVQIKGEFKTLAAGSAHVLALDSSGAAWSWGSNAYGQLANGNTTNSLEPKKIGSGYQKVAAGNDFSLLENNAGKLFGAGSNGAGQLGNGTTTDSTTPVETKPISEGSTTGTGGTGGTGGTSTGAGSDPAKACAKLVYPGKPDPQITFWDQIAQFDQCAYRATGDERYVVDGNRQCKTLAETLAAIRSTFKPYFCNGALLIK
jgi:alpha-tubulin suppressor-like RCC1 family protein